MVPCPDKGLTPAFSLSGSFLSDRSSRENKFQLLLIYSWKYNSNSVIVELDQQSTPVLVCLIWISVSRSLFFDPLTKDGLLASVLMPLDCSAWLPLISSTSLNPALLVSSAMHLPCVKPVGYTFLKICKGQSYRQPIEGTRAPLHHCTLLNWHRIRSFEARKSCKGWNVCTRTKKGSAEFMQQ